MWSYQQANGLTQQFEEKDAKKLFQNGVLLPQTPVWNQNMNSWQPACETELAEVFPESERKQAQENIEAGKAVEPHTLNPDSQHSFRDPEPRMNWVVRGLKLFIAGGISMALAHVTALSVGNDENVMANMFLLFGSLGFLIGLLTAGISFMCWTKRVSENAHAMSDSKLTYSPNYACWSYVIPFVNLWIPRAALAEIWQVSYTASQQRGEHPEPSLMNLWWGAFIGVGIIERVAMKAELTTTMQSYVDGSLCVANIFVAFLAITVVKSLTSTQLSFRDGLPADQRGA